MKPVTGDMIWMQLEKTGPDGEVIFTTRHDPFFAGGVEIRVEPPTFDGDIMEAFTWMCSGDSAVVLIPAALLDSQYALPVHDARTGQPVGAYYTYYIRLFKILGPEDYTEEIAREKERQEELDRAIIAEYMRFSLHSGYATDSNGLAWKITIPEEGKKRLADGDSVAVHYVLRLVDGQEIDNSYRRNAPFHLRIGSGSVIDGWELGLMHFAPGEKGVLAVPSALGYGRSGSGVAIPPHAVLIFEIEVVDRY